MPGSHKGWSARVTLGVRAISNNNNGQKGVWLGTLMLAQPEWGPATAFYLLYVLGVVCFVVLPALARGSARRAALMGAFFGLVAYGTYDLSNWATLQGWSAQLALMDMAWGALLTCLASLSGYWASRKLAA